MTTSPAHGAGTDLPLRIHFLGVGGAGVSGVARILAARGRRVTGHDRAGSGTLAALEGGPVEVRVGPSRAEDLPLDAELVVRSAAVPDDDPQVAAARARGVPVRKYADVLPLLAPPDRTVAVAGTHGKTTTAWMLHHALEAVAERGARPLPGAIVGGICRRLGTTALAAVEGGWFAVEACEYDRTFLRLAPFGAAITNVEGDHLDYYGSVEAVEDAFARFADRVSGLLVLGRDVPARVEAAAGAMVWRLGRELEIDLAGERAGRFRFRLRGPGWATPVVELAVPGAHNVENAALALALAVGAAACAGEAQSDAAAAGAAEGLARFLGVERRFEPWGEVGGVEVVHDYAHHPTELRATLETARRAFPGRALHVLFQPHQHSRTARFLDEFVESLRAADRVVVAEVYGARAHVAGERAAGAPEIVLGLRRAKVDAVEGGPLVSAVPRFAEGLAAPGCAPVPVCALVIGAGDVEHVRHDLLDELALRRAPARGARA